MALDTITGSFHFTQAVAATSWVIAHNLNVSAPVVDFWIDDGGSKTKVFPLTVVATDANTVTATFSTAQSGEAVVV